MTKEKFSENVSQHISTNFYNYEQIPLSHKEIFNVLRHMVQLITCHWLIGKCTFNSTMHVSRAQKKWCLVIWDKKILLQDKYLFIFTCLMGKWWQVISCQLNHKNNKYLQRASNIWDILVPRTSWKSSFLSSENYFYKCPNNCMCLNLTM